MKQYQQGDVLFKRVDEVKGKEVKAEMRGYVFAEGETTGHYHASVADKNVKMYEENGVKYFSVLDGEATVTHQEHGTVTLPKGNYQIGIVQEYDPFAKEINKVRD